MNNYQSAKQTSNKLLVKESRNHEEEMALIPSFVTAINRLDAITIEIDAISIQQEKDITGITSDKNTVIDQLGDFMVDISGAVHSYAISINDKTLLAKVNYKESVIERMSQPDLLTAAGIIIDETNKIDPQVLINEGISNFELTEFKDIYAKFVDKRFDTREAIIDRTGYTQKLADLFNEASDLKKNTLDRLASQFKRKAPEFYQKYNAAAMVIYKQSHKTPVVEA